MTTTGSIQCSDVTGCGATWTWGPAGTEPVDWMPHSWTSELDARLWADTHLTVCAGPIEVVPSGEEATV